MGKKPETIEGKLDRIAIALEKTRVAEYIELINNRKRFFYINFIQGLVRGFGMAVGFTALGALFIYFLKVLIKLNIPLIGDFITDIVKIVQENL